MPEYLSPGVYVEEFKIGAQPIEGVSTSTAAFVGIAEKGPLNKPTLVTNQRDFTSIFGGYIKDSYLAYAVDGFFRNGGKRCFIVRVADSSASKASQVFYNLRDEDLMKISALTEGKWGNDINIKIDENSSGATTVFLSSLEKDVKKGDQSIKLSSTKGLSEGMEIIIDDGDEKKKSSLIVRGVIANEGVVNLKDPNFILHDFKAANTRVYAKITPKITKIPVKSVTGFIKGTVLIIQQAAQANSVNVTLKEVKQSENVLEYESESEINVDGAVCIDVKGTKKSFSLNTSAINSGVNSIPKSNIKGPVDLLENGDKVTFIMGKQKETLAVKDKSGDNVVFNETFKYNYAPGKEFEAMTSSKTTLFEGTYKKENLKVKNNKALIKLEQDIKGLRKDDWLTLIKEDSIKDFQIYNISDDGEITLTSVPDNLYKEDDVKVRFTLKNQKTIVVTDPEDREAFSANNLIEIIDTHDNKKSLGLFKITNINQNRITFEGTELPEETNIYDAEIIAKQWVATSIRSKEFKITVTFKDNELIESFDRLSIDEDSDRYFAKDGLINKQSKLIEIEDTRSPSGVSPTDQNDLPKSILQNLIGGYCEISNIKASDFIGTIKEINGERTGIRSLEPEDDISLLAIPDIMNGKFSDDGIEQVQLAMIEHCENLKDRFAILDPIKNSTVQAIQAWRKDNLESKYAALYYPWIKVSDLIGENNESIFIPPSGYIAGIYARSDTERGVHKAPANEVISGVIELERNLTTGEQEILNPDGINCIRAFPGRGIRVWGARTISSDSLWKYINIRRLFIYIEKSIERNTQWVVFEPNNEKLWARVRATITQFLTTIWKDGALMGTKVEEAFFVKCDRTTMTQDEIDNGKLICVIGIAPVKPAEFVIFRIAQWTGGSAATE